MNVDVLALDAFMTRRATDTDAESLPVDARRLSFPLQLGLSIGGTVVAVMVTMWTMAAGLRSDVRDIQSKIDYAQKLREADTKLQDERVTAQIKLQDQRAAELQKAIDDVKTRGELLQLQFQNFKEDILKAQTPGRK